LNEAASLNNLEEGYFSDPLEESEYGVEYLGQKEESKAQNFAKYNTSYIDEYGVESKAYPSSDGDKSSSDGD
jgi:hypothetical protein